MIVGVGIILGSWLSTAVVGEWASSSGEMDYVKLFSVPMYASLACFALLLILYPLRSPKRGDDASILSQ